ncbi:PilC beta-propeller domain-containing protein [Balnearium lithotrophicum]|uniref:PilC beta-propeller domain-containing protein n=1 Tax=Balnearium lithotrophicum TaxID=223788 RepID=A0A521CY57_9BACT|nr:PilC/PilY family type IV pilus protein [Balnearium lithotrophicum]SMO64406.1 PilC beta-propeller domain-containing protein [Balnearium lithotrophicum]
MFKAFIDCIQPDDYQNLISYIRGIDFPELRSRRIDGETPPQNGSDENVWKLGDIVYSTPWIEKYDNYTVAFVGANDGMLHAFRVGYLKRRPAPLSPVSVQNDRTDNETDLLGEELWAFIPQNVLPYLALLANKNYKHIYTVDLKPFVVHIKHDGKERKILVGGMRLGGAVGASDESAVHPPFYACPANLWKEMKNWCEECTGLITLPFVGSNFICNLIPQPKQDYSQCYGLSSYFALDVTDPENPKFLWEFTHPDLGFSYSGGTVVKKKDKYYIMFGSGPTNYKGDSNQSLRYFVLDLLTGDLKTTIDKFTSSARGNGRGNEIRNAFSGRMNEEAIDVDGDGKSDYVVVGYARKDGNMQNWKGGLLLFDVRDDNPKNWYGVKYFTDAQSPVTAAVKFGKCFNKIYLFFGTGRWFYKTDNSLPGQKNRIYGVPLDCDGNECRPNVNVAHSSHDVCVDIGNHVERSWYLELNNNDPGYLKERVISDPTVTDENVVFFTTIEPTDDPCGFGGRSRVWALNCATGGTIYSACPGGKYAVSPPEGKLYFQLSGANIIVINPKTEFGTNEKNASPYSKWYQGIAPETGTPFVGYSKGLVGKLLFWIER